MSDADLLRPWMRCTRRSRSAGTSTACCSTASSPRASSRTSTRKSPAATTRSWATKRYRASRPWRPSRRAGCGAQPHGARQPGALSASSKALRPEDIVSQLNSSQAGRGFMSELRCLPGRVRLARRQRLRADAPGLARGPERSRSTPSRATWRSPTTTALTRSSQSAIKRREELLAEARAKIGNDAAKLSSFNDVYESTSCFTPIVEDHNHWIDQMGDITMRYPALELGRRCVARGTLANGRGHLPARARRDIVEAMSGVDKKARRRSARQSWSASPASCRRRSSARRRRPATTPSSTSSCASSACRGAERGPGVINGVAASPGTVTATAKVVRSLEEASKLQAGDVLVCEMTLPPWTPLFSTAAPWSPIRAASCRTAPSSRASTASRASSAR